MTRPSPICDRDTCHHERDLHLHYRGGADCGVCPCVRYLRRPLILRALDRLNIRVTITNRRNSR